MLRNQRWKAPFGFDGHVRLFGVKSAKIQNMKIIHSVLFILAATIFEASGDALIRKGIYNYVGSVRVALMLIGAVLVFAYGFSLNLAPLQFGQLVGLYIAILFTVWQVVNFIAFKATPTLPTVVGGILIIAGGLITTFWKPQ
jgi:hypothetical protein